MNSKKTNPTESPRLVVEINNDEVKISDEYSNTKVRKIRSKHYIQLIFFYSNEYKKIKSEILDYNGPIIKAFKAELREKEGIVRLNKELLFPGKKRKRLLSSSTKVTRDMLQSFIDKLKKHTHLEIDGNGLPKEIIQHIFSYLSFKEQVDRVCIRRSVYFASISRNLPEMSLVELDLYVYRRGLYKIKDKIRRAEVIRGWIEKNPGLKSLSLNFIGINNDGLKVIQPALEQAKDLKCLDLRMNWINKRSLKCLKNLKNLKELYLDSWGCRYEDRQTDEGIENILGLKKLRILVCELGLIGTEVMVLRILKELPQLTEIDFGKAPVTDDALDYISRMKYLDKLSINGAEATDKGTKRLIKSKIKTFIVRFFRRISICPGFMNIGLMKGLEEFEMTHAKGMDHGREPLTNFWARKLNGDLEELKQYSQRYLKDNLEYYCNVFDIELREYENGCTIVS
jgi:hypothetical protein